MPVRFPIYARAASLTTLDGWRDRTLGELVIEDHQRRGYPGAAELAELFSRELIHGSCLAMIDGIDEITSLEDRRAMVDLVGRFDDRWGSTGNRFVVTSRSAGDWRELIRHFATYQACDVGREQRAALLARYCLVVEGIERPLSVVEHLGATAKQRAVDVVSALRQSRGLARLATNPLLLTVLILGQRSDRGMPTQRAAAYDAVARLLETGWSVGSRVEVDDLPDHRLLRRFLVQLAGWIQEHRPSGVVDLDDLLAAVGELWTTRPQAELAPGGGWSDELRAEVERVVAGICRHHGLLIERGPQQWSFLHRGLQEYYVARSLIDQPAPAYAIRCRLHDRDYAEPVLLALGIATHVTGRPDAAEVFDAALLATGPHADTRPDLFVPADLEELIGRDRKFAVLAAADEVDIDPRTLEWLAAGQIPKDLLPGLAGTALGRRHSAHRLAQAVASGAGHDVRWACGASLAQLGEKATAAELFRSLAVDPGIPIVRQ
jgi:hypothetical protein